MAKLVVVLSGPIGVGKSTLTRALTARFGAKVLKTRELLDTIAGFHFKTLRSRKAYQDFGEAQDAKTGGQWVADAVHEMLRKDPAQLICIDSVRIQQQIDLLRGEPGFSVFHLHLTAERVDLENRFSVRITPFAEAGSYAESQQNETERAVESLANKADAVVNTSRCTPEDVVVRRDLSVCHSVTK